MPITYDPENKTWEWDPETQEEYDAFLEIGKTAMFANLAERFSKEEFNKWLALSKKQMFNA